MAAKKETIGMKNITMAVPKPQPEPEEVRVRIKLPLREDDSNGLNMDHFEHVTIGNELGEQVVRVQRGQYVDVTIPVFIQLRNRFPDI